MNSSLRSGTRIALFLSVIAVVAFTGRGSLGDGISALREALAPFEDVETAMAEGWSSQFPAGCMASEAGAMGYHYLNESLVDGAVELLKPELLIYERQADGSQQLVAVEYIIPFDQWQAAEPPRLLEQEFARNETYSVWALHIWAWRANPDGTFAAWNPNVSCGS